MSQELLSAAQKFNEEFILAMRRKDLDRALTMFSEGAILMPPGANTVDNVQKLKAFLKVLSEWTVEMTITNVRPIGSSALRETGTIVLNRGSEFPQRNMGGAGARPTSMQGQYLGVLENVDNQWRRNSLIWNRGPQGKGGGIPRPAGQGGPGRPVFVPRNG